MNPFATRSSGYQWIWPTSAMALVLGVMLTMAWITAQTRQSRFSELPTDVRDRLNAASLDFQGEYFKVQQELKSLRESFGELREENTKLQNAVADQTKSSQLLNESLQEVKTFAGLTEVEGPGLMITLRDAKNAPEGLGDYAVIHDIDVLKVVNELWNAGAESISVNDLRVGPHTNFRCVGSVILVDRVQIASPVVIRAIGDPKTLEGALDLPLGVLAEIRQVEPAMVKLERVENMRMPGFAGSTKPKFMKAVPPKG
ncbi:MAG: DUF881 domain-containing protein [Nitrospirae bacterium]|nr:DUF881 domain-containing protein [Fimbriimonadaceae bacterium]